MRCELSWTSIACTSMTNRTTCHCCRRQSTKFAFLAESNSTRDVDYWLQVNLRAQGLLRSLYDNLDDTCDKLIRKIRKASDRKNCNACDSGAIRAQCKRCVSRLHSCSADVVTRDEFLARFGRELSELMELKDIVQELEKQLEAETADLFQSFSSRATPSSEDNHNRFAASAAGAADNSAAQPQPQLRGRHSYAQIPTVEQPHSQSLAAALNGTSSSRPASSPRAPAVNVALSGPSDLMLSSANSVDFYRESHSKAQLNGNGSGHGSGAANSTNSRSPSASPTAASAATRGGPLSVVVPN